MKIKKNKIQQGFTLIELMIVVSIIGILASIALPAYQDYIIRAKITPILTRMASFKAQIEELYHVKNMTKSNCNLSHIGGPKDNATVVSGCMSGRQRWFPDTTDRSVDTGWGRYEQEPYIKKFYVDKAFILVEFNGGGNTGLPAIFQNKWLALGAHYSDSVNHKGGLVWKCGEFYGLPHRYLPSSCRNSGSDLMRPGVPNW